MNRDKIEKNKFLKVSLIITMLALITLYIISGTLAKYASNVNGTDTARVAKFDYTASGLDKTNHTLNLFDTTADTGIIGDQTTTKLIAPGTEGSLTVELENKGEVAIKAAFSFTETNTSSIPVVYEFGGNYYSSVLSENDEIRIHANDENTVIIEGDLNDLATAIGTATNILVADGSANAKKSIDIAWAWAFEGVSATNQTDITDTTLGEAGDATIAFRVDCNVEQIDN